MGTVALDYGYMENAESSARRAASLCENYTNRIQSRVTRKLDNLQYGSTGNTSTSSYFASQKMRSLNEKHNQYINFADRMRDAKNYAKEKDRAVSSYIKKESNSFRKTHGMEVNKVVEWFTWLTTTIINKTSFGRWIAQKFKEAKAWLSDLSHGFRQWFELDGGKYILKTVLAVVGMVIAAALLVLVAWPAVLTAFGAIATAVATSSAITGAMIWTAITATGGFVTAIMSVANNVVKIYGNAQAYLNNEEDPGWANRYGGYSSFSEMLRKEMFSSGFANKISYIAANIYDIVGITASIISITDLAHSSIDFAKTIQEKGAFHIFDKVHFKSPNGKMTWGTFKYGLKHLFNDVKIARSGIKATNISRINSYYKAGKFSKLVLNFQKVYTRADQIVSTYDSMIKHGVFKTSFDRTFEKIRGKTVSLDFMLRVSENTKKIMKLNRNMYTVTV